MEAIFVYCKFYINLLNIVERRHCVHSAIFLFSCRPKQYNRTQNNFRKFVQMQSLLYSSVR